MIDSWIRLLPFLLLGGVVLLPFGCATVDPSVKDAAAEATAPTPISPTELEAAMERVEALYAEGRYAEALIGCIDIERSYPNTPGLRDLQQRVLQAHLEDRFEQGYSRDDFSKEKMSLDALEAGDVPDSYKARRYVDGEERPFLDGVSPLAEALDLPVTMHLQGADLSALLEVLSTDTNLNVIADQNVGGGKKIDVHVEEVPLREVLEYISRNMGVAFHIGENVLWVSAIGEGSAPPLRTRVYRLHSGIQWHGGDWGPPLEQQAGQNDLSTLSNKATVLSTNKTYIETLIDKFASPVNGAERYFERNTHTLFVKDTWENLEMIESILDAVDVNPPQVFIEARFIEIDVADLRELGVEWILDSPWVTSTKTFLQQGQPVALTRTQVDEGRLLRFTPFTSDDEGTTPLGPQGPFGELREGVPPTVGQGLNLTYQGILTEPMFTAVLHALDISGKGRTLSVPRVTTVNNNPAKLRNGQDLLYFEQFKAQAFSLLDENRRAYDVTVLIPDGKPALEELGITLIAVPSVGADRETIALMLTPTISELEGFISYQDIPDTNAANQIQQILVKLPIINRREVQTKVVVRSGETVVMGGLIETVQQETVHKVPFLGDIPGIGKLFQRLDMTEKSKNLLIFVTATVLSERGESLLPLVRAGSSPASPLSQSPADDPAGGDGIVAP